jgi:aspartate aminotransferase
MFNNVETVPPDAIFDISTRYKADPSKIKLNLGVGAYRTDAGEPLVL